MATQTPLILKDGKVQTLGPHPLFIRGLELFELETRVEELTYTGNKVTAIEVFNNTAKLTTDRRARTELTYTGNKVTQEDTFYYASDGVTVERQVQTTLTYSGNKLTDSQTVEI
jgi:hypothetical protein